MKLFFMLKVGVIHDSLGSLRGLEGRAQRAHQWILLLSLLGGGVCLSPGEKLQSQRKENTNPGPHPISKHAKQLPVTLLKISNPGPSHFVSGHEVAQTGGLGGGGGGDLG